MLPRQGSWRARSPAPRARRPCREGSWPRRLANRPAAGQGEDRCWCPSTDTSRIWAAGTPRKLIWVWGLAVPVSGAGDTSMRGARRAGRRGSGCLAGRRASDAWAVPPLPEPDRAPVASRTATSDRDRGERQSEEKTRSAHPGSTPASGLGACRTKPSRTSALQTLQRAKFAARPRRRRSHDRGMSRGR